MHPKARRRLAHGWGTPAEKYGWKPFGYVDYGYDKAYMTVSSWTIWALVTWGSISVDMLEGVAVLAGSLMWSEYNTKTYFSKGTLGWGTGASWVHNVQAGYCWYHYFVKGQRQWPLFLGSWAEMAGDLGAVAQEVFVSGHPMYSHKAHYEGASIGMTIAFLLDIINPKKGEKRKVSLLWGVIPFATIALLFFKNIENVKWRQNWERRNPQVALEPHSPLLGDDVSFWSHDNERRSLVGHRHRFAT